MRRRQRRAINEKDVIGLVTHLVADRPSRNRNIQFPYIRGFEQIDEALSLSLFMYISLLEHALLCILFYPRIFFDD